MTTQGKCYHKVYTLFQANFKVSYEARYNVTEFIVLKHMHISIKKKKKKEQIITEYKFISCAFRKTLNTKSFNLCD